MPEWLSTVERHCPTDGRINGVVEFEVLGRNVNDFYKIRRGKVQEDQLSLRSASGRIGLVEGVFSFGFTSPSARPIPVLVLGKWFQPAAGWRLKTNDIRSLKISQHISAVNDQSTMGGNHRTVKSRVVG